MTTFIDGPAKGQKLMLRRAVKFLRVTQSKEGFDALDQPEDSRRQGEICFAYQITAAPSWCHLCCSPRSAGGFFAIAEYKLCTEQPPDRVMRDNAEWSKWCKAQPDPLPQPVSTDGEPPVIE